MSNPNVNVVVSGPKNDCTYRYKTYILRGNMDFASQVTEPNMKYVIKYDFDLNDATIQMPAGSILDFEGGSVNNGKLVSNKTEILGKLPENENVLYGLYYRDNKPLGYNLNVTRPVNTCVDFAFMSPSEFTDYRFYPQGIAVFYYNDSKYFLLGGNIEGTNPERAFLVLFDSNFDFIGSTETPYPGHGGGLAVCDDKLYMCGNYNPASEHPTKMGIAVYNLSDVISFCTANQATADTSVVYSKIPVVRYIQLADASGYTYNCADISYDSVNEEFAVTDGDFIYYIFDKNFNIKRYLHLSTQQFVRDKVGFAGWHQGCILRNGVVYGTYWASDYPAVDRGNNIIFGYDTIRDEVVFTEYMSLSYTECECEGMAIDPDDSDNFYFLSGINLSTTATIIAIHRGSKINSLFGLDSKKEGHPGIASNMRSERSRVWNKYDFSNGISNGSSDRPFKTIGSAIATMFARGDSSFIDVVASDKEYYLPYIKISGSEIVIYGRSQGSYSVPTIKGSIWSYGASVRINNVILNVTAPLYVSGCGFLYVYNSTIQGNTTGQATKIDGIRIRDTSTCKLEKVTVNGCRNGVDVAHGTIEISALTLVDCDNGIIGLYTTIGVESLTVRDCNNGVTFKRASLNLGTASFTDVTTCFYVDDSFINTYAPKSITLTNVETVILKDSDFKGRVNLMCGVNNSEEFAAVLNFIKSGAFMATTIGFLVDSEGIVYDGLYIDKGTYIYDNPGFIKEGCPHLKILEIGNERNFVYLPSCGTFNQRPVLANTLYRGFVFHNTSLGIDEVWEGGTWVPQITDPVFTPGKWRKLGEITPEGGSFDSGTITITDSRFNSTWNGWTNLDGQAYRRIFNIDTLPFAEGDIVKVVVKNPVHNMETIMSMQKVGVQGSAINILDAYNTLCMYAMIPNIGVCDAFYIIMNTDSRYFDGTIEIYKKIE